MEADSEESELEQLSQGDGEEHEYETDEVDSDEGELIEDGLNDDESDGDEPAPPYEERDGTAAMVFNLSRAVRVLAEAVVKIQERNIVSIHRDLGFTDF